MKIEFDQGLARGVCHRREELRTAERLFYEDTLRRTGLTVGQVLRNRHTGATYVVESAHVYTSAPGDLPCIVVQGRRTYATGRWDAASISYLSLHDLVPETGPATKGIKHDKYD